MKLFTGARYGTRELLDLLLHSGEGTVLLSGIARRQEISVPHLGHLILPLVAASIVRSTRGARAVSHYLSLQQRLSSVKCLNSSRVGLHPMDMLHCHIVEHEDIGVMGMWHVIGESPVPIL